MLARFTDLTTSRFLRLYSSGSQANMNTHAKQCSQARAVHNGKTNIFEMKCSHCPKMFTSKKALDSHKLKSHPGSMSIQSNNSAVNLTNGNNLNTLALTRNANGGGPLILRRPKGILQNTQNGGAADDQAQNFMARTLARMTNQNNKQLMEQMMGAGGSSGGSASEEGEDPDDGEGYDAEDSGESK